MTANNSTPWATSFVQLTQLNITSNIAGWLSLLASTVVLLSAPFMGSSASTFMYMAALGGGLGASVSFRGAASTERTLNDYSDVTAQNTQTNLFNETLGETVTVGAKQKTDQGATRTDVGTSAIEMGSQPLTLFDWTRFDTHRNEYPHLAIVAGTGAGKSTLAEWLCSLLGGRTIVVAPHWEQGDYTSADLIIGMGRNYGTSAEPYIVEEDKKGNTVVKGEPEITEPTEDATVMQFLNWLVREMDARYQLNADGRRVGGELLNVVLDEIPSYSAMPGYKDALKVLIREARKVGIRLILMLQGSEVKAYGFDGEGQLRENLTTIRLGKFAINEAAMNYRNTKGGENAYWSQVYEMVCNADRPALIEDVPGSVPTITREQDTTQATEPEQMDDTERDRLKSLVLKVAELRGEPIRPSDVSRYERTARGTKASEFSLLFSELEEDGKGTVNDNGRFSLVNV